MTLAQIRKYALSLPEAEEKPHFELSSYRVRGKIFVTIPPGDTQIRVFLGEQHREPALALHSEYVQKLLWGGKVVGLTIELAKASPSVTKDLVRLAWESKAPKALHQR